MIQIDTTNILFICGGAFEGIEKIVEKRIDQKSIGFNAEIAEKHEDDVDRLLQQIIATGSCEIRSDSGTGGPCAGYSSIRDAGQRCIGNVFLQNRRMH